MEMDTPTLDETTTFDDAQRQLQRHFRYNSLLSHLAHKAKILDEATLKKILLELENAHQDQKQPDVELILSKHPRLLQMRSAV